MEGRFLIPRDTNRRRNDLFGAGIVAMWEQGGLAGDVL